MGKCERFSGKVIFPKRPETGPSVDKSFRNKPKIQAGIAPEKIKGSLLLLVNIGKFTEPRVRLHFGLVMGGVGPVGKEVRRVSRIAFPEDHPEGTAKRNEAVEGIVIAKKPGRDHDNEKKHGNSGVEEPAGFTSCVLPHEPGEKKRQGGEDDCIR